MRMCRRMLMPALCVVWVFAMVAVAQTGQGQAGQMPGGQAQAGQPQGRGARPPDPKLLNLTPAGRTAPDEPFAKTMSLEKTRKFLDTMAVNWTRERKCGTCHTNIAYMLGRWSLGPHTPEADEVRNFFADRAARWDSMGNAVIRGDVATNKGWGLVTWFQHEVIVTAAMLALDDAGTSGTLEPITREVLERMWALQRQDGGWYWLMAHSQPFETSEYYGSHSRRSPLAMAPDDYAQTPAAQKGLQRREAVSRREELTRQPYLHDRIYVLWAASKSPI